MQQNIALEQELCGNGINHGEVTICHRKRKNVHLLKREFRRNRTETNYKKYKQAADELKRRLRQEKQEYMVKSIQSLQDGNSRQLFSQFRSMNSNKLTVIPAIISP
jgi:ERCC4-type nuclease